MPRKSTQNEDEIRSKGEEIEEKEGDDVDPKKVASDDDEVDGDASLDDADEEDDDLKNEEEEW